MGAEVRRAIAEPSDRRRCATSSSRARTSRSPSTTPRSVSTHRFGRRRSRSFSLSSRAPACRVPTSGLSAPTRCTASSPTTSSAKLIGDDLVKEFGDRLYCHDAEDQENLVHLGTTPNGYHVELNKAVVDDDLTIYLNCSTFRGFQGGWKSICVGLSTYRSIAHHHNPDDMSMSLNRNRMHEMLDEMGQLVTKELGPHRIFKLETIQANPIMVSSILGGTVDATRAKAVEIMRAHQSDRRDLVQEKVDVVVYGIPDFSPYAAFSHLNPILTLISTGLGLPRRRDRSLRQARVHGDPGDAVPQRVAAPASRLLSRGVGARATRDARPVRRSGSASRTSSQRARTTSTPTVTTTHSTASTGSWRSSR